MQRKDYSPADRVLERIAVGPTGCWDYTGYRLPTGYGQVRVDGKKRYTHRVVYEALVGPIPYDLVIDHLCANKGCVNPAHLEVTTHIENARRALAKRYSTRD